MPFYPKRIKIIFLYIKFEFDSRLMPVHDEAIDMYNN